MSFVAQILKDQVPTGFYGAWMAVFESERVPVLSPEPVPNTSLLHDTPVLWYRVDVDQLTSDQINRYVDHSAKRFRLCPIIVRANVRDPDLGLPILADGVEIIFASGQQGITR